MLVQVGIYYQTSLHTKSKASTWHNLGCEDQKEAFSVLRMSCRKAILLLLKDIRDFPGEEMTRRERWPRRTLLIPFPVAVIKMSKATFKGERIYLGVAVGEYTAHLSREGTVTSSCVWQEHEVAACPYGDIPGNS